jgi:putative transposase
MTSPLKEPSATISTNGVAAGFGSRFMMPSAVRSEWPPASNPNPVPGVSTAKPSRRLEPAGNAVTTRGKKIKGVKRHILVDTLGLLLAVVVHPANIQDRDGAKRVFAKAKRLGAWPRLERVWADGGYAGKLIVWVSCFCQWVLEIVKRNDDVKGFKLLPKRWVVERTFSWLSNYRRLSKHYEYWNETGEAMIQVAMIHIMLRRLTKKTASVEAA